MSTTTSEPMSWDYFPHSALRGYTSGEQPGSHNVFVYVSAPAIYMDMSCNGAWFTTASFTCVIYYYNWNTLQWVNKDTMSGSASGSGSAQDKYFYHNWNGQNTYSDDTRKYHLWKFQFSGSAGSGGNSSTCIKGSVGNPGMMSREQYNDICQGKLIVSAGRLGGDWFHASGSNDDTYALNQFRWSDNSGTSIEGTTDIYASGYKIMPKSWV